MGRSHRSSSTGSVSEATNAISPQKAYAGKSLKATREVFDVFIALRNNRNGKSFLHCIQSNHEMGIAQSLLGRASQVDQVMSDGLIETSSKVLESLLLAKDLESGYSPLHWAMMDRNLAVVLQILRHVAGTTSDGNVGKEGSAHRLAQRPMQLLQGDTKNAIVLQVVNSKDMEGLTPLELLCRLLQSELTKCRRSLATHSTLPAGYADSRRQVLIDPDESIDNEFFVLQESSLSNTRMYSDGDTASRNAYGCEVLTFGRVNHCALGGDGMLTATSSSAAKHEVRPQRVQAFALADVGREQSAVAVAAAAHHTLVATRNGKLYAFGLGKGGRLGTGDERHMPAPTRVMGPLARRRVVAVAAAENHSICATSDGRVYTWGSNRFGQLGSSSMEESTMNNNKVLADSQQRCLPRRVDNLKHVFCVSVAAGDRHSVALSNRGEVYAWGDNQAGQLGIALRGGGSPGSSSGGGQQENRVDALWAAFPRRVVLAIAAAAQSTLVLTAPPKVGAAFRMNAVFSWGHGNHVPIKVNFSNADSSSTSFNRGESSLLTTRGAINPVAIACAKYHNAAVSSDGRVFTWGLHAEPLGTTGKKTKRSAGSMVIASPEVVTGMLPENGGGMAVAVSVCESHTAVLTDCGHLYTWGATYGKDVLGHEGVSWQPIPKKVPGVYRAVGVAAAKEHTVLLVGTSFPRPKMFEALPDRSTPPSLETVSAKVIANHVDLFNVIPILTIAERANCNFLTSYCQEFIRLNLDGVLTLGKKSEMDRYLNDKLADGAYKMERYPRDLSYHPLLFDLVGSKEMFQTGTRDGGSSRDFSSWLDSFVLLLDQLPISLLSHYQAVRDLGVLPANGSLGRGRRDRALSFNGLHAEEHGEDAVDFGSFQGCSERCMMLTATMNLNSEGAVKSKHDCLSKEIRSVRKRLNQITRLQESTEISASNQALTKEQKQKIGRRPLLQADLAALERALEQVERKIESLVLTDEDSDKGVSSGSDSLVIAGEETKPASVTDGVADETEMDDDSTFGNEAIVLQSFKCSICKISCPDSTSFALHNNGKKHRNRVSQLEEEGRKETAASMMEMKRRQLLAEDAPRRSPAIKPAAWQNKNNLSVQPKYKLPPPPSFPSPEIKGRMDPSLVQTLCDPKVASFRRILDDEERGKPGKSSAKYLPGSSPRMSPAVRALHPNHMPVTPPTFSLGSSHDTESVAKKTTCLGDFWGTPPSTEKKIAAPWSAAPVKKKVVSTSDRPAKSFLEIQQEEQAFRTREEPTCALDGHWYIQQRERAGSISHIQQEEAREREHLLLVEEQKRIEAEIMREQAAKKQKAESVNKKKQRTKKKKGNASKQQTTKKKDQGTNVASSQNAAPSKDGKKRTRRRNNNNKAKQPTTTAHQKATTS